MRGCFQESFLCPLWTFSSVWDVFLSSYLSSSPIHTGESWVLVVTVALPSQSWGINLLQWHLPEQGWLAVVLGGHSSGTGKTLIWSLLWDMEACWTSWVFQLAETAAWRWDKPNMTLVVHLSWPQGECAKIQLQVWALYGPGQLPLVCATQKHHRLQGRAEKASKHADTCLIAVALKKFHFCGMPEATRLDLEFQLKG